MWTLLSIMKEDKRTSWSLNTVTLLTKSRLPSWLLWPQQSLDVENCRGGFSERNIPIMLRWQFLLAYLLRGQGWMLTDFLRTKHHHHRALFPSRSCQTHLSSLSCLDSGGSCLKGYLAAFKTHSRKVKRITIVRPGRSLNNLLIDVSDERVLSGLLSPLTWSTV